MRSRFLLVFAWLLFVASVYVYMESEKKVREPALPVEPYLIQYVDNYDGDTVRVNIPGFPDIVGKKIPIRISGVDTPEMKTKNKCEKKIATRAKLFVESKMRSASKLEIRNIQRGKYFRLVADVYADGVNLGQELLNLALAVPYDGGRKAKIDWCLPLQNVKTAKEKNVRNK